MDRSTIMNILFTETPRLFGQFHLAMLVIVCLGAVLIFFRVRGRSEPSLLVLLHRLGLIMILMEIFKQWFVLRYVYPDFSLWFFPWQLCSMAMYCSFFITIVREKYQPVLLVFLSTFSFFSAIVALAVPSDMLRPQILLAVHGFIYHGIMILEALIAITCLGSMREGTRIRFAPAAGLFLVMCAIAEVINCIGHYLLPDHRPEPDMFYITPFYPSTQPVCDMVAAKLGILPEIIIYITAIILISWLYYLTGILFHDRFHRDDNK